MATVLVADDEPGIRNLICEVLQEEGYDVVPAQDGLRALERVKEAKPDLAVIDLMMPGLTGDQVVEGMDQAGLTKTPVIYISAVPYSGKLDSGRPAIFMSKPFDLDK